MNPMIIASLIGGAASLGGGAMSMFGGKNTAAQGPLETPEQASARQKLMDFVKTGQFGNFTIGEDLGLGDGDFNMSGQEKTGLSNLQGLLDSGMPSQFGLGNKALEEIINGGTAGIDAQFDPFREKMKRLMGESADTYKRNAAFGKGLYSSATMKGLSNLEAQGNETMAEKLAGLTNESLNRKLSAASVAYQGGQAQEATALGRINASQQYGGLARQLNDANIKAHDAEILRRHEEMKMPLTAAANIIGQNPAYGVKEVSVPSVSPFQNVLDMIAKISGDYFGNEMFMKQFKNNFGTPTTKPTVQNKGTIMPWQYSGASA